MYLQVTFLLGSFYFFAINGSQAEWPRKHVHWGVARMHKPSEPVRIQKLHEPKMPHNNLRMESPPTKIHDGNVLASGGSILTCNTVKCKGGHKCIMTTDECYLPFTTDPFNPTNCESRPKCVPDKICKACGPNEHRSRCSICERTCEDPNRYKCKKENICGQNSRCVCDSGHVRDKNGKCIKYENCPNVPNRKTTTTMKPKKTTTTPEEEEGFIIIKRKETKQRHEQIDLLKPSTKHPDDNNEHENENSNGHGKPNNSDDRPEDGFIVVKEKEKKHTKRPSKKTTEKPNDGFIIVEEKQNNHKPNRNPKPTSNPGKNTPKDKPDNHNDEKPDDGFIIVKEKGQKQTKRPSKTPTEKPNDGFIVVNEKQKNHNDDKPKPYSNNNNGDNEYFVSKKKVQNNKHEQINLM